MTTIEQAAINMQLDKMRGDFLSKQLPERMWPGIRRYLEHGIKPGQFLCAVIANDLRDALNFADDENIALLPTYIKFFHNCVPGNCWGSSVAFQAWTHGGGYSGGML